MMNFFVGSPPATRARKGSWCAGNTGLVLRTAGAKGLSEPDKKEVANDVFLQAIERARGGRLSGALGPWLRTAARHRAIDRYRRNKTRSEHDAAVVEELELAPQHGEQEEKVYPYKRVVVRQALRVLEDRDKSIGRRNPDESDVEVLRRVGDGITIEDLATYLGTNVNAARQRKFRALKRLREVLEEMLEE